MPMVAAAAATAVTWVSSAAAAATAFVASGLTAIGVSSTLATAIAGNVLTMAVSSAASFALTAVLAPRVGSAGSPISFKADPSSPIRGIMGRFATGGTQNHMRVWGKNNLMISYSVILSLGPIQGIEKFEANQQLVTFPGPEGLAANVEPYKDKMWMTYKMGLPTDGALGPPNVGGNPKMTEWTANHKTSGYAGAFWTMQNNSKRASYEGGVPPPLWTVLGQKLYDPRKDSTQTAIGGVGAHRLNDWRTWEFSKNNYVHALNWALGHHKKLTGGFIDRTKLLAGVGAPIEAIDLPTFVAAANVADANDWTISGEWNTQDDKWQVFASMLQAGSGMPVHVGAKIGVMVNAPRVSVATITSADIIGKVNLKVMASRRDRFNTIYPRYINEDQNWEYSTAGAVTATAYRDQDNGEERPKEITYNYVDKSLQAGQLAAYDLANTRETLKAAFPAKPHLVGIKPGDAVEIYSVEHGLDNQKFVVFARPIDIMEGVVSFEVRSETDSKHAYALGQTDQPAPSPGLTAFDAAPSPPEGTEWNVVPRPAVPGGTSQPGLVVTGEVPDGIGSVLIEYGPTDEGPWSSVYDGAPTTEQVDINGLEPGETYYVSFIYRAVRSGIPSERLVTGPFTAPDLVSGDTVNVDGLPAGTVVNRLIDVESLSAANAVGIADLVVVYGDTVSAAESAAEAAISASDAIAAEAAAVIAQGLAQGAATTASTQATNAASSAAAALTSQNSAATSATNSSNSATTAAGHASSASTSAGAAATSATNAGNSATAAAGSASTASTQATNAGNSASAAAASAVSASSSFASANLVAAMTLPDRYDGTNGQFFSGSTSGSPAAAVDYPSNATASGYGPVYQLTVAGSSGDFSTRGVLPAVAGRIYKVESEFQVTAMPGTVDNTGYVVVQMRGLDSSYASLGATGGNYVFSPALTGGVQTTSTLYSNVASTGVTAWTAGAVWLRPYVRVVDGNLTSITVQHRRLTVTDVTEQQAAAGSATAAATSASSAATSATNAGSSASAASTSATNAATSAGAASTSATNASNSATTAAGHASTASTQATNAANSALAAGNSATAANTSASNAATSATNAGNSATAANTSAVNAASSFTSGNLVNAMRLPDRYDGTAAQYFTGNSIGNPSALVDLPSNATAAGYGPVREIVIASGTNADWATRGAFSAIAGRIYKVEVEYQRTALAGADGSQVSLFTRNHDASYAQLGLNLLQAVNGASGSIQTLSGLVSDTASTGVGAWTAGTVWLRPFIRVAAFTTTSLTVQFRRLTVTDVTERQAAAASATAAATSASNASTSASAAGSSATAASTSATNAATSAGAASTSATNASNSATTAAGHASNASTSATNAANSATAAGNSATAASGSASTASTAATNAGNSATAAAASQVSAASSYDASRLTAIRLFPDTFSSVDYWTFSPTAIDTTAGAISAGYLRTVAGVGPVWWSANNPTFMGPRGVIYTRSGRRYRTTVRMRVVNGGNISGYITNFGMTADGVSPGNSSGVAGPLAGPTFTGITSAAGWITVQSDYAAFVSTSVFSRPVVYFSVWTAAEVEISSFKVEDVTDSYAATTSANAASTSASSAATSATNAGTSATAASGSATTASTQAGNASTSATSASTSATNASTSATAANTSATNAASSASAAAGSATTASTQASAASASAAAAASSASVAASVGVRSLYKNPSFNDYTTTPGVPNNWIAGTGATPTRVTGETGLYGMQMIGGAGADAYIQNATGVGAITPNGYYVMEASVRLDSGALTGSGMLFRVLNSVGGILTDFTIPFATDTKNNTGAAIGAGTTGRTYRFAKLIQSTNVNTSQAQLFAMAHWSVLGSNAAANQLTWFLCSVRPATDQEIASNAATTAITSLNASVVANSSAIVDLAAGYAEARLEFTATTGGGAARFRLVSDTYGSIAGIEAEQIYWGANTYFDDATDTLRTTSGGNVRVLALGASFGTDGQLTEWEGPAATAFAAMSRANAYFYRANVAPYAGGSALPTGGAGGGVTASTGFGGVGFTVAGSGWQDMHTFSLSGIPLDPQIDVTINPISVNMSGGSGADIQWRIIEAVSGTVIGLPSASVFWAEFSPNDGVSLGGSGTATGTVQYKVQARLPLSSDLMSGTVQIDFNAYQVI